MFAEEVSDGLTPGGLAPGGGRCSLRVTVRNSRRLKEQKTREGRRKKGEQVDDDDRDDDGCAGSPTGRRGVIQIARVSPGEPGGGGVCPGSALVRAGRS